MTVSLPDLEWVEWKDDIIDKWKAKKSMWRIRETALLMLAILGGSIGAWIGMNVWHHKTQKKKFRYGVPAIIIIQLALIGYLLYR